jgi:hypothetical protein
MMMKADTCGGEGPRSWLANVVKQRGQSQNPVRLSVTDNGYGVREDILVAMQRVLLQR